jgi:AraC-like DNA-binding protein
MEPSSHNDIKSLALSPKPLYKKSHILGINIENKILELNKLMELEKVFLDEDLHSGDLAAMLALTPHQLSQLLSQVLDTHYHKMIQEYRIQEAIQRIKLNEDKNLLTIGFEVGFQSKSAFNTAFKKITGNTPMELKKSLLSENQPN